MYKLQKAVFQNKVNKGFNTTDIGKEIILMVEELGELACAYKNSNKKPAKEIDNKTDIVDAVGDLMVYCLGLCEMLGEDSGEVVGQIVTNNETRTHTGRV